jgi:hypothetical protein
MATIFLQKAPSLRLPSEPEATAADASSLLIPPIGSPFPATSRPPDQVQVQSLSFSGVLHQFRFQRFKELDDLALLHSFTPHGLGPAPPPRREATPGPSPATATGDVRNTGSARGPVAPGWQPSLLPGSTRPSRSGDVGDSPPALVRRHQQRAEPHNRLPRSPS